MTMPLNVSIVCVPGKVFSSQQVNLNSKTFGLTSLHINTKQVPSPNLSYILQTQYAEKLKLRTELNINVLIKSIYPR